MNEIKIDDDSLGFVVDALASKIHSLNYVISANYDYDTTSYEVERDKIEAALACFVGADNVARTVEEYDDRINGRI